MLGVYMAVKNQDVYKEPRPVSTTTTAAFYLFHNKIKSSCAFHMDQKTEKNEMDTAKFSLKGKCTFTFNLM